MRIPTDISPRRVAVSLAPLAALLVLVSTPQLLGRHVASAGAELADASPLWLWLALGAVLVPPVLFLLRRWMFEARRWQESDHAGSGGGDDA